jgi:hypothetical protein
MGIPAQMTGAACVTAKPMRSETDAVSAMEPMEADADPVTVQTADAEHVTEKPVPVREASADRGMDYEDTQQSKREHDAPGNAKSGAGKAVQRKSLPNQRKQCVV